MALAQAILSTLLNPSDNLSFLSLIQLRVAFLSITGNDHGEKNGTSFYIIGIEESGSEVLSTVLTEHDQQHELKTSRKELLQMIENPILSIEDTFEQTVRSFWQPLSGCSSGGKGPRMTTDTVPMEREVFSCWCCGTEMSRLVRKP